MGDSTWHLIEQLLGCGENNAGLSFENVGRMLGSAFFDFPVGTAFFNGATDLGQGWTMK